MLNPFSSCGDEIEFTVMDKIRNINEDILNQNDRLHVEMLIFGDSKLSKFKNTEILNSSIE